MGIATDTGLDFDALQLRIHPAASRVKMLAAQMPASVIFFDLLCVDDRDLRHEPFATRRAELESLLANADPPIHITPATRDRDTARDWFHRFEGAGLDGVVAKPVDGSYQPDKRVMLKIKHERDCDCVVAGFRWYKDAAVAIAFVLSASITTMGAATSGSAQLHEGQAHASCWTSCTVSRKCSRRITRGRTGPER
jgi:ATP-dependent DNA ligase